MQCQAQTCHKIFHRNCQEKAGQCMPTYEQPKRVLANNLGEILMLEKFILQKVFFNCIQNSLVLTTKDIDIVDLSRSEWSYRIWSYLSALPKYGKTPNLTDKGTPEPRWESESGQSDQQNFYQRPEGVPRIPDQNSGVFVSQSDQQHFQPLLRGMVFYAVCWFIEQCLVVYFLIFNCSFIFLFSIKLNYVVFGPTQIFNFNCSWTWN